MKQAVDIYKTSKGYAVLVYMETPLEIGVMVYDEDKIAKNLKAVQKIVKEALREEYIGINDDRLSSTTKQEMIEDIDSRGFGAHIITIYVLEDDEISFGFHYLRGTNKITEYLPRMKKHEVMFALDEILARKEYRVYV